MGVSFDRLRMRGSKSPFPFDGVNGVCKIPSPLMGEG